jgi:hypothetical protein
MTPEARKAQTEAILKNAGIQYLPSLPCIESEEETTLRSPEEIGIRIACLFCVVGNAGRRYTPSYGLKARDISCRRPVERQGAISLLL